MALRWEPETKGPSPLERAAIWLCLAGAWGYLVWQLARAASEGRLP